MDPTDSEKSLIEKIAQKDKESIESIYRDNFGMIRAMVISNNGSADDAADIFQETMIVLFEKSKTEGFELNCQLKTFLYSIARRLWLKRLQQSNKIFSADDSEYEIIAVEEDIEYHEKRNKDFLTMDVALGKIGEPCKSLLEAYYIQKKPMQQIATDFGYTNADNAKTQKYKCLVRLKKLFFQQYKSE